MSNLYNRPYRPDLGDLMTIEEFRESVASGLFMDDDGHGYAVKDGMERINDWLADAIYPSMLDRIPEDATHIAWYGK